VKQQTQVLAKEIEKYGEKVDGFAFVKDKP